MPTISNLPPLNVVTGTDFIPVFDNSDPIVKSKRITVDVLKNFVVTEFSTGTIASNSTLGLIRIGDSIEIDNQGLVDISVASTSSLGGIKVGNNLNIENSFLNLAANISTDSLILNSITQSNSTQSGTLIVKGSTGIAANLALGGNLYLGDVTQSLTRLSYNSNNFSKIFVRPSVDLNGNGAITSSDAVQFLRYITGVDPIDNKAPYIIQHYDNTTTGIMLLDQSVLSYTVGSTTSNGMIYLTVGDKSSNKINAYIKLGNVSTIGPISDTAEVTIKANTVYIGTGTTSTSIQSGALVVNGGAGISGPIYVNDNIYIKGHAVVTGTFITTASYSTQGTVRIGSGFDITEDGTLSIQTSTFLITDPYLAVNLAETAGYVTDPTGAGIVIWRGIDEFNVAQFYLDDNLYINTPTTSTRGIFSVKVAGETSGMLLDYLRVSTGTLQLNIFGNDNPLAVMSVAGTTDYENQVTDDDSIPNRKFVVDYFATTATSSSLGTIKIGTGLFSDGDGTINATQYILSSATNSVLGGVKIGNGIVASGDGTISVDNFSVPSSIVVLNQGSTLTSTVTSVNFVGDGIIATNIGTDVTVTVASSQNLNVKNEGTTITNTVTSFNFVGAGVNATTVNNDVTVTISGGSFDGGVVTQSTQFTSSDPSASTSTGAITVVGGIGVGDSINVGKNLTAQTITATTTISAQNINIANTVTALSFQSISAGVPEVYSESNLNLTAAGRVQVTQSPFKVWAITSSTRDSIIASNGDIIYNNETHKFQGYANGVWIDLH